MKTKRLMQKCGIVAAVVAGMMGLSTAQAAIITWGSAENITGSASDVVDLGTVVLAYNIDKTGADSPTVNGVTFIGALGSAAGLSNDTVSNYAEGTFSPVAGSSTAYGFLQSSAMAISTSTLTLSSLTIGDSYTFEWWSHDGRSSFGTPTRLTLAVSADAGSSSVALDEGIGFGATRGPGQFAIGTFVANSTTELINFSSLDNGSPGTTGLINGYELLDTGAVPEPSTVALIGLGGLAFLLIRRRHSLV